jgi:integrase
VYRYKGVLLAYQKALQGAFPTLQTSVQFLLQMQRDKFSESAINVHRAALKGFHDWRGEKLDFQVKRSRHQSRYIGDEMVKLLLEAAKPVPIDYLILRLMSDAGLRRDEVVGG